MARLHCSLVMGALAVLTSCSTNPATGRTQFNLISESKELELGAQSAPQFIKQLGGEIPSDTIRRYVSKIGKKLAAISERPTLPWTFTVVDSKVLNAFALPGGHVFISRGLLAKLHDEAMLAGVLGHEVGHTTAQHIGQQMSRQMLLAIGVVATGTVAQATDEDWLRVLGVGAQVGGGALILCFSRDQEHQSDELGVRYLVKTGYDPHSMVRVLEVLAEAAQAAGSGFSMFSTHPDPASRIRKTEKELADKFGPPGSNPHWIVNADRFREMVLEPLAALPPPKHSP